MGASDTLFYEICGGLCDSVLFISHDAPLSLQE